MQSTTSSLTTGDAQSAADLFLSARRLTADLAAPLSEEDCCVQSQTCCSPVKWHLGHTTWFFERFIIREALGRDAYDDRFEFLFNSYYNGIGDRQPRSARGLLTRPGLGEIMAFRSVVDEQVSAALSRGELTDHHLHVIRLGLNHEQQHQELLLMDVKHLLSCNPLDVEYIAEPAPRGTPSAMDWHRFDEGLHTIGACGNEVAKSFDNELPSHRVFLEPFELADRLVTNGDFKAFIDAGGYDCPASWLDLGWAFVNAENIKHPLYWRKRDGVWQEFTLHGWTDLDLAAPVLHVSMFEADAFARWSGARLPTEFELEAAWDHAGRPGALLEDRAFHPRSAALDTETGSDTGRIRQLLGDAWEWTSSSYGPYPGYSPPAGAVGEYNGKFMCNQYVLRGGSFATPRGHIRKTYRNYFQPEARWAFSGIRLARSV